MIALSKAYIEEQRQRARARRRRMEHALADLTKFIREHQSDDADDPQDTGYDGYLPEDLRWKG
ncbi:MAG: hypothetical protein ABSG67_22090 [Thermoguttaceae bacterium]